MSKVDEGSHFYKYFCFYGEFANVFLPELKFMPTIKKLDFPLLIFLELSSGLFTNGIPEFPTSKDGPFGIWFKGQCNLSFQFLLIEISF